MTKSLCSCQCVCLFLPYDLTWLPYNYYIRVKSLEPEQSHVLYVMETIRWLPAGGPALHQNSK